MSGSAPGPNRDPAAARLVTDDVPRFWRALDEAADRKPAERARVFRDVYLAPGSAGLRAWARLRLAERPRTGDGASQADGVVMEDAAEQMAAATAARPRFYAGVRSATLSVRARAEEIRDGFVRFEALYPDAVFPDVYFMVGRLTSMGTLAGPGLLLGVEMFGRDARMPLDELSPWERAMVAAPDALAATVAHELAHVQQRPPRRPASLLGLALYEGAADWVAERVAGIVPNSARHEYGNAHEAELWAAFSREMHGTDGRAWFYQGDRAGDRPADLGYYLGYRVCEAFHRRAADPAEALRRMLTHADPAAFLRESGYHPGLPGTRIGDAHRPVDSRAESEAESARA